MRPLRQIISLLPSNTSVQKEKVKKCWMHRLHFIESKHGLIHNSNWINGTRPELKPHIPTPLNRKKVKAFILILCLQMERISWGSWHWNGIASLFIFSLNIECGDCIITKTNNQPNTGMFVMTGILSKHLMAHKSLWKLFKKKELFCLNLCQDKYHRIYFLLSFYLYHFGENQTALFP